VVGMMQVAVQTVVQVGSSVGSLVEDVEYGYVNRR